jgi:hypothetical protein
MPVHRITVELTDDELTERHQPCFYCTHPDDAEPEFYAAYWVCTECRQRLSRPPTEH